MWDRIHTSGVRYHNAYDKGMERLSCCFCVLASRKDLTIAARHNPDLAAEYVAVEDRAARLAAAHQALQHRDIVAAADRLLAA